MVSGLYQLLNASCMLCERSFSTHFLKGDTGKRGITEERKNGIPEQRNNF